MPDEFKEQLGVRMKVARKAAGIDVPSMARRLHCSPVTVYAYEKGQNQAPVDVIAAYARATGCSADELLGLRESALIDFNGGVMAVSEGNNAEEVSDLTDEGLAGLIEKGSLVQREGDPQASAGGGIRPPHDEPTRNSRLRRHWAKALFRE